MAQLISKFKRIWLIAFPPESGNYRIERGLTIRARKP